MKISFGGIKNTGSLTFAHEKPCPIRIDDNNNSSFFELSRSFFHTELTNEHGHDLNDFKEILKKYPNKFNPNSIDIAQIKIMGKDKQVYSLYTINDEPVVFDEKNLKTYIKMFNLFKRVLAVNPEETTVDKKYLKSPEILNSFKFFTQFFILKDSMGREKLNLDFYNMVESVHNIEWAKKCAVDFKNSLSTLLTDFFMNN